MSQISISFGANPLKEIVRDYCSFFFYRFLGAFGQKATRLLPFQAFVFMNPKVMDGEEILMECGGFRLEWIDDTGRLLVYQNYEVLMLLDRPGKSKILLSCTSLSLFALPLSLVTTST